MPRRNHRLFRNLQLRGSGLLLLTVAGQIFHHLYQGGHAAAGPAATLGEMALTAIGFFGASAGTALAAVGAGLLDPVEVSERWVIRPIDRD